MSKSASVSIKEAVKNSIQQYFPGDPFFVIGVSGGADSMALMYCLYELKIRALVVHVNYNLRGEDARLDQELVEGFSSEWGMECCSVNLDPENRDENNLQNWARKERYEIFRALAEEYHADAILTAHHQDDQVETIFQKILRGSGVSSWSGMKEREGDLFRPLLGFRKEEIMAFCDAQNIPYRTDKTNLSPDYARNFLRNELGGEMDRLFPGWKANILRLKDYASENELATDQLLKMISSPEGLKIKEFSELPDTLRPAIIKRFLELKVPDVQLSRGELMELEGISGWKTGASMLLNEDWSVVRDRDFITLKPARRNQDSHPITKAEAIKGVTFGPVTVRSGRNKIKGAELCFDATHISWPVIIRPWKEGDVIRPLGMKGTQKVSDHLTNRKISSSKRENALILSGADGTIYAIIYPEKAVNSEYGSVSESVKITAATDLTFSIQLNTRV